MPESVEQSLEQAAAPEEAPPAPPGESRAQAEAVTDAATPVAPDPVLLGAVDLARRTLLEVAAPETVGPVTGHVVEGEHVLTLQFAADLPGYPGWHWSVTLARVDDEEPTVVETQLMPGERALRAPDWVPWSERLAEYRAAQAAVHAESAGEEEAAGAEGLGAGLGRGGGLDEEAAVDEEVDDEDLDDEDLHDEDLDDEAELDAAFGHDEDDDVFDGIDIDAFDESASDDDDEDDDDDDAAQGELRS